MSASAELACVPPEEVREFWPHVAPLIAQAMRRGAMGTFADVEAAVLAGRALLWLACRDNQILAAAVTQLTRSDERKICTLVALAGSERPAWLPLRQKLEAYASAEGCSVMQVCGRIGWGRLLPDYRVRRIVLEKEI
jgi:hypothetical protein